LPVTYDDLIEYGIHRHAIAPAIRELVALGFVQVTRMGSAGHQEHRQPTLFLLTYYWAGSNVEIQDGWRRIKSLEEAEAIAAAARATKADPRARDFGQRGGKATAEKRRALSAESALKTGKILSAESAPIFSAENAPTLSAESAPLSIEEGKDEKER
jgi:hypothetical protein